MRNRRARPRHNGGPPIADYDGPPWGDGEVSRFLYWREARKRAWKSLSPQVALMRLERAERLGLTFEEYSLEVLERGRFLQLEDTARIAEIKAARKKRRRS